MGASGVDVQLSTAAKARLPMAIEAKNQEAIGPLYAFWQQTVANAEAEKLEPLLIVKRNRETPLAVLDAEYFFKLIGKLDG